MTLTTRSPEQTQALGRKLGRRIRKLDLVLLIGPLGAGKTTLMQGLAEGAGVKARAVSPTFALARTYRAKGLVLHHLDLFRLASTELGNVGLEEYTSDEHAACVIEWPEAGVELLPKDRLELRFDVDGDTRRIAATAGGRSAERLLAALKRRD